MNSYSMFPDSTHFSENMVAIFKDAPEIDQLIHNWPQLVVIG